MRTIIPSIRRVVLLALIIPALALYSPTASEAAPSGGEKGFVQVKSARLMDQPKLWGKPVATLSYGEEVSIMSDAAGGWFEVKNRAGKSGYLHQSALTSSTIVLRSGAGAAAAASDGSDVVLAGKGFNSDVERQFAASGTAADFRAVDQVEQLKVAPTEIAHFIKQGRLAP